MKGSVVALFVWIDDTLAFPIHQNINSSLTIVAQHSVLSSFSTVLQSDRLFCSKCLEMEAIPASPSIRLLRHQLHHRLQIRQW